jgi:hypothetical protein
VSRRITMTMETTNWLWVGVDPRPPVARVLATTPAGRPVLKARLEAKPRHPRALATLLEALALWQGVQARGVLAVGEEEPWCDMDLFQVLGDFHVGHDDFGRTPLYRLTTVDHLRRRKPWRDPIGGMGEFRDVRQLRLFGDEEVQR